MKVTYIRRVDLPEFLAGQVGDERDLDASHALRLWGEGYVSIVPDPPDVAIPDPPDGVTELSEHGQAIVDAATKTATP